MLNDHQGRVRNVDTHLHHGGGGEDPVLSLPKAPHRQVLLIALQTTVELVDMPPESYFKA